MQTRLPLSLLAVSILSLPAWGQNLERRAVITGDRGAPGGHCSGEVVVDGAADIELRGAMGRLIDVGGRNPEWRRLECTNPLPPDPGSIRFTVNGRGQSRLVRDPREGGTAVIHIEDPEGGAEIYRFELFWNDVRGDYPPSGPPDGAGRFTTAQAIRVCQDEIRQMAVGRFGRSDVAFQRTGMDDNPGRNDWVAGVLEVRPFNAPEQHYRFSCSVNFATGRVRSANIEPARFGGADRVAGVVAPAVDNCRTEVARRLTGRGYRNLDFGRIAIDNRPGRNDRVAGNVRGWRGSRGVAFNFSCSVNLNTGSIRSVNLNNR
jgi:hypothetical protein